MYMYVTVLLLVRCLYVARFLSRASANERGPQPR
jgi:hypothetical protein